MNLFPQKGLFVESIVPTGPHESKRQVQAADQLAHTANGQAQGSLKTRAPARTHLQMLHQPLQPLRGPAQARYVTIGALSATTSVPQGFSATAVLARVLRASGSIHAAARRRGVDSRARGPVGACVLDCDANSFNRES
jgi:hypothetical protein